MQEQFARLIRETEEAVRRNRESPAYRYLRVILRPTASPGIYEFMLENVGAVSFWHLVISRYQLIGPPAFGVDDTFMRLSDDAYPPIFVPCIAPGQAVKLCEERWRPQDCYHLHPETSLIGVRFSLDEANQNLTSAGVPFVVVGDVPLRTPEDRRPWYQRRHPRAHALGKATGAILRGFLGRR